MQEELNQLSSTKFDNLFLDLMIDQQLVLNKFLEISWMSRGNVIRNKVRLVAQDYPQIKEIDFVKIFAPIALLEAIQMILAFAF